MEEIGVIGIIALIIIVFLGAGAAGWAIRGLETFFKIMWQGVVHLVAFPLNVGGCIIKGIIIFVLIYVALGLLMG